MPAGEKKNQLSLMDIHWEKTYSKADPYSGETDEHGRTPYFFWGGDFCFGLHTIVLLIIETKCYLHLY